MKTLHICKNCKRNFSAYKSSGLKFCSQKCAGIFRHLECRILRTCRICHKDFYHQRNVGFCSRKCFFNQQITVSKSCKNCKKVFTRTVRPSELRKYKLLFCSLLCSRSCKRSVVRFGEQAGNWRGGISKKKSGYLVQYSVNSPGHRNYQHRLIAEKRLGRPLLKTEVIHHINEDKSDNRLENLYLFPSNKEHARHHRKNFKILESNIK